MSTASTVAKPRRCQLQFGVRAMLLLMVVIAMLPGCAPTATPISPREGVSQDSEIDADIDRLIELMRQRLLLMHQVARWKWDQHRPITDTAREAALLKQTAEAARQIGLDAGFAVRFMKAQVAAGKLVQQQDWDRWQTQQPSGAEAIADLSAELRPKIDRLGSELLKTLARLAPRLNDEQVQHRLSVTAAETWPRVGLSAETRITALEPLLDAKIR